MYIIVKALPPQQETFRNKGIPEGVRVDFIGIGDAVPTGADAYFDLCFEEEGFAFEAIIDKIVFVNAVIETNDRFNQNTVRVNAWNGFLERDLVEIVAADSQIEEARQILDALGWRYQFVADTPGMIAARVIAMIINEAYFGWGDGISSKQDIDTAMKLGTNYPLGPFEWAEKIGLKRINALLQTLSTQDDRYTPAPALQDALKS